MKTSAIQRATRSNQAASHSATTSSLTGQHPASVVQRQLCAAISTSPRQAVQLKQASSLRATTSLAPLSPAQLMGKGDKRKPTTSPTSSPSSSHTSKKQESTPVDPSSDYNRDEEHNLTPIKNPLFERRDSVDTVYEVDLSDSIKKVGDEAKEYRKEEELKENINVLSYHVEITYVPLNKKADPETKDIPGPTSTSGGTSGKSEEAQEKKEEITSFLKAESEKPKHRLDELKGFSMGLVHSEVSAAARVYENGLDSKIEKQLKDFVSNLKADKILSLDIVAHSNPNAVCVGGECRPALHYLLDVYKTKLNDIVKECASGQTRMSKKPKYAITVNSNSLYQKQDIPLREAANNQSNLPDYCEQKENTGCYELIPINSKQ